MAKVGTAHIEIKPVLNEDALNEIVQRIEDAVAAGVKRGMQKPVSTIDITDAAGNVFRTVPNSTFYNTTWPA